MAKKQKKDKQKGFKSEITSAPSVMVEDVPSLQGIELSFREFSTGSVGAFGNGQVSIKIGTRTYKATCNVQLVLNHSKEWPDSRPIEADSEATSEAASK